MQCALLFIFGFDTFVATDTKYNISNIIWQLVFVFIFIY